MSTRNRRQSSWQTLFQSMLMVGAAAALGTAVGCDNDDPAPPTDTREFTDTILPIFTSSCATAGCHDATTAARGLVLDSYDNVMAGGDHGNVVIPFQPLESLMIQLLQGRGDISIDHDAETVLPAAPNPQDTARLLHDEHFLNLVGWVTDGCKDDDGNVPFDEVTDKVYVTNQGAEHISVISVDDLVVTRLLEVEPFANGGVSAQPHYGSMSPNNSVWFATLLTGSGIWIYDQNDGVVEKIETDIDRAALSVMLPDASKAYISHFVNPMSPSSGAVSIIDMATRTKAGTIPVLNTPHGMAMAADGSEVYVGNFGSDHISVIDTATDQVSTHIPVSETVRGNPDSFEFRVIQIAAHPSETLIYASCTTTNEIRVIDRTQETVVDSLVAAGGAAPWHLKVTPDGEELWVAMRGAGLGSGAGTSAVAVFDTDPFALITVIQAPGLALAHGLDFDKNGRYCFVASENLNGAYTARYPEDGVNPGTCVIIDTTTKQVVQTLEMGAFATGVFATR